MVAADCNSESDDESLKLPLSKHVDALPIPKTKRPSSSSKDDEPSCWEISIFLLIIIALWSFLAIVTSLEDEILSPNFQIADATTVSATVNLFNNSVDGDDGAVNYLVSGRWNMTLILENPNPTLSINYTALHVQLWYKSRDLEVASILIPPFIHHQHMGETRVSLQFTADQQYVDDDVATHIINGDDNDLIFGGVTLFARYEIQRNKYFFVVDKIHHEARVNHCYPLLSNPFTENSSNLPSTSNSTSTPCV